MLKSLLSVTIERLNIRIIYFFKGGFVMLDYRYNTFLVLAEQLNYTRTAEILLMSQSTVTKHIQYLEENLQVKLFTYKGRSLSLTNKGVLLKKRLSLVSHDIEELKKDLVKTDAKKSYVIGVSRTIGEFFLPKYEYFPPNDQNGNYDILVENTTELLKLLDQKRIDFALISGPIFRPDFEIHPFYEDELVLACSPNHPMAGVEIPVHALCVDNILLREEGAGVTDCLTQYFQPYPEIIKCLKEKSRIGNINLLKSYLLNNEGTGFLYKISIEEELKSGSLQTIPLKEMVMTQEFYLVIRNDFPDKNHILKLLSIPNVK